jgi:hypothetical protein
MQHDSPKQQPLQQQQQQQMPGLSINTGNSSSNRPSSLHLHSSSFMGNSSSSSNHTLGIVTGDGAAAVEHILKFETQMYKIRDDEYAIDVQVS